MEKLEIKFTKVKLDLFHPWTIARGTAAFKENVIVELSQDGVTGYGEASHMTSAGQNADETIIELNKIIPDISPFTPEYYSEVIYCLHKKFPEFSPAKAAVEIAIMDWTCKKLNIPLYRLFSLNPEKRTNTSLSIGIDTPEVMKTKLEEAKEFKVIKIKLGTDNDKEIIELVRSLTDKPLTIDANQGWRNKEDALHMIKWLKEKNTVMIEQPLPVKMEEEQKWLKEHSPLPIIADEAVNQSCDILKLKNHYHGINIKLMKSGGILEAYHMASLAKKLNLKVMLGCMIETSLAITAAAHLQSLADWVDLDGSLLISNDPFKGAELENGQWALPNRPGIGVIHK